MNRIFRLPIMTFVLITTLIFVGCGTKETSAIQPTTDSPKVINFAVNDISQAEDAVQDDSTNSPEIDTKSDKRESEVEVRNIDLPINSVLRLIPANTMGLIYCPSLMELNDRINRAASALTPQFGQSQEMLAQILAEAFGAGFTSLEELEHNGLDITQDFAVFFSSIDPLVLSAVVHLTDVDVMKQVIEDEVEGNPPIEHNGVSYWSTPEESMNFTVLDNILVFSQIAEICENVIDVNNESKQSISHNADYSTFLSQIIEGKDQVYVYFHLESIIDPFLEELNEELQSIIDSMQSDPSAMSSVPMIEGMFTQMLDLVEQVKSFSATLQVEGTDVQLAPFLQFKKDGKIQDALTKMAPTGLTSLESLPNEGFLFCGFEGNAKLVYELSMSWMSGFAGNDPALKDQFDAMLQKMVEVYDYLEEEWSISVSVSKTFIPDYLVIYTMKDEEKVKTYYNKQLLDNLSQMMKIMRETVGDMPQFSMYDGAYIGNPIMHNGVEIKSFVFPNFGASLPDIPAEVARFMPQEWHWSYAFSDGMLYFAIGGPEQIRSALDSKGQLTASIAENVSFQKLVGKLSNDNNILFGFSPLNVAKGYMNLIARADRAFAAELQMVSAIIDSIPENYSIGVSGKVHDGGVGAKLLITLGDFRQLINTMMMLPGMGQIQ